MKYISLLLLSVFPTSVFAAIYNAQGLLVALLNLFNSLIYVVFGFALVLFFWGLAKFILKSGDEKSHEDGRRLMFWGVIALFVMASIWGIIAVLQDDFGIFNV